MARALRRHRFYHVETQSLFELREKPAQRGHPRLEATQRSRMRPRFAASEKRFQEMITGRKILRTHAMIVQFSALRVSLIHSRLRRNENRRWEAPENLGFSGRQRHCDKLRNRFQSGVELSTDRLETALIPMWIIRSMQSGLMHEKPTDFALRRRKAFSILIFTLVYNVSVVG